MKIENDWALDLDALCLKYMNVFDALDEIDTSLRYRNAISNTFKNDFGRMVKRLDLNNIFIPRVSMKFAWKTFAKDSTDLSSAEFNHSLIIPFDFNRTKIESELSRVFLLRPNSVSCSPQFHSVNPKIFSAAITTHTKMPCKKLRNLSKS